MKVKTLHEIHDEGLNALLKTLGPVDLIRFIQMFDHGRGDYTNCLLYTSPSPRD